MNNLNGGESPASFYPYLWRLGLPQAYGETYAEIPLASHRPSPLSQLPAYTEDEIDSAIDQLTEQERK